MPEPQILEQTCPLCLNADELPDMILVPVAHYRLGLNPSIRMCRRCATAIATAWLAFVRDEEPDLFKAIIEGAQADTEAAAREEKEASATAATADDGDGQD